MIASIERTARTVAFLASDPGRTARTGRTPHEVVHRQGKAALRFFPAADPVHPPAVVVMPLINTWTIWDLLPGRSVVQRLTAAGVPVYVVDWGRPGDEDALRPLSFYVDEVLGRAFERARRHAGGRDLQAVGYCVGGTLLAVHLALDPDRVIRAAFVAAPIDFHGSGRLARWADPARFPLDVLISSVGNFPADLMKTSFAWLKPAGQSAKWMSLWERIEDDGFRETWAAMEQWNADAVDFPGEAYREYVRRCYFENALVRGGWTLGTRPVDLRKATMPALTLSADRDHIAPTASCDGLAGVWGGPVTREVLPGGHVGISVGSALPARLAAWLSGRG